MGVIGWQRALARLALVAFALGAAGLAGAEAPSDPPVEPPRSSASAAPAPAGVLGLLPPGARSPVDGVAVSERSNSFGRRAVERINSPFLTGDISGWLEVEYTVDPDLDQRMRGVLEGAGVSLGHLILMDPATGEVYSYVSTDPETFPSTRPYPTASLMKVVTAAALQRNAPEAASRDCRYLGSPWELHPYQLKPPEKGGRVVSFQHAIAISNNQCFARYAIADVGEHALLEEIRRVGFLDPPGAGHAPGRVLPVRGDFSLGQLGSGVAGPFITPLSAVRLAAALAEGELVEPYWISRVRDAGGNTLSLPRRREPQPIWPPAMAAELREAMVEVTEGGTARSAFVDPRGRPRLGAVRVSGKTGTATGRAPAGRYRWFIGVAPAEAPRVAIATLVVDHGGRGHGAARVAAAALAEVFCEDGRCDAARAERLHARAAARDAERARETQEWKLARRREALERERLVAWERARRTAAEHTVVDLDHPPHPIGVSDFAFPPRLRRSPVDGKIVLLLEITERGEVEDVQIASSDLPAFNEFVSRQVSGWTFEPATQGGLPVRATARLPIPIRIN